MTNPSTVRSQIVEFLRRELIGPDPRPEHASVNGGDEVLRPQDPPRLRYSAGILFPGRARVADQEVASAAETESAETGPPEGEELPETSTNGGGADSENVPEYEVNRANQYLPSAMGLTALVRLPAKLVVTVRAAQYERIAAAGIGKPDKEGNPQPHHYRRALPLSPIEIDCAGMATGRAVPREIPVFSIGQVKLALHILSRPYSRAADAARDRIVTFTLINRTAMSGGNPKDSECFFQCEFAVQDAAGSGCFLEYPEQEGRESDEEQESLGLLYRHRKTFAIGHGCAGEWEGPRGKTALQIRTESLPTHELTPIIPAEIHDLQLSMVALSSVDSPDVLEICRRLARAYLEWIERQEEITGRSDFPPEHRAAALRHIGSCRACHGRIEGGISLLSVDADTRQAFAWMNQAMLQQQLHYDLAVTHRRPWVRVGDSLVPEAPLRRPDYANPGEGKGLWRPFQLAFILMNLRAIVNPEDPDRNVVDLIWFPTGGGKTEAYLGLTAFTIFRRRLADFNAAGTTVLMRYTLRLLTAQQFQRAASLICACESIRRGAEQRLGSARISGGLWVGQGVTPNKNSDAVTALNGLLANGKDNEFVLLTCPWCGAGMGPTPIGNVYQAKGYRRAGSKVIFRCEDEACDFSDSRGLPLLVVDEAIYEERPTLLIGTVDKFAMLPWYAEPRRLFGLDDVAPVQPPDLVIQDELHLISGALGSMVGMYETTIDALCQRDRNGKRIGAKIVASTATICRAADQVRALYGRPVSLFPPQGLRAGDSFFAKEEDDGQSRPGRLYLGVFGTALSSHVTAQVRVLSSLLQGVKSTESGSPEALDPYWTLMVYFNSLRELGHAATLIRADIREHMNAQWDRHGIRKPTPDTPGPDRRRFINRDLELTSRISSSDIADALQQLFNRYPGSDEARPVDVCLATNMIQVGLDVPRLGLMAVVGQPKTTSEYIQATSRVGRDARGPGLVVTVLNPGKPRDRSHFEHFRSYHQSIYRWVEPTSVTPFAVPVRERALHAQLATLVRYWGGSPLRSSPKPPPTEQLYRRIRDLVVQRIAGIDPEEAEAARRMLDEFLQRWRAIEPPLYGGFGPPPQETPLLFPNGSEPRAAWAGRSRATPSSMRNVDASCSASVILQFPQADAE